MTDVDTGLGARFVGARTRRKEDPRLLSGQGSYVGDIQVPGMLHAAYVRSPYARARINGFDLSAAKVAPGIHGVFTGAELSEGIAVLPNWRETILATRYATFVGEPLVLVVADTRAEAEDACELVEIDYEPLDAVADLEAAMTDAIIANPDDTTNVIGTVTTDKFDTIDAVLAAAPHVFTERIDQHRYVHSPMETRGILGQWHSSSQTMTIWFSTQGPHPAVAHFARVLKIPQNAVRVIAADVGGAFGQKIQVSREESAIPVAARLLNRPVKWIEDRYENLVAGPHARREFADVSVASDDDGRIIAFKVDHYQDVGAYGGAGAGGNLINMIPGPYRVERVEVRTSSVRTNTSSRASYRGPWMLESVIREVMMDVVARGLGIDPLEIRRRNIIHRDELPYRTATNQLYDLVTADENMERAAAIVGYDAFRKEQEAARAEGRYLGLGFSVFVEPSAGGARNLADGASIRIDTAGKVLLSMGSGSQGHSIETTMCQIVADELGVDISDVKIVIGDTAATPFGATTGGSRSAVSGGNSAWRAAVDLKAKVLDIAAHDLEASPEDLEIQKGVITVKGVPTISRTLAEIAQKAQSSNTLPDGMQPGLETFGRHTTETVTWSNAAHIAIVEVDPNIGKVKVNRYVVSEDCGVIINPNVVEGQIAGGVIQGVGGVLYEHFVYDPAGNPLTTTYLDYLIETSTEVPEIEYDHLETYAPTNPGGFKGMGEGGAIGAPAAVVNAVSDALAPLGVKPITRQPLTPPVVLDLIKSATVS